MNTYQIIQAPDGGAALQKDGLPLGSTQPLLEAKQQIASLTVEHGTDFIFLGLGLGYNLKLLESISDTSTKYVVIEKDIHLLYAALCVVDIRNLLNANRLLLIGNAGPGDTSLAFASIAPYLALFSPQCIELPSSVARHMPYYSQVKEGLLQSLKAAQVGFQSSLELAEADIFNRIENATIYASSVFTGTHHAVQRIPQTAAVLVAAGPSLQKNINELKKASQVHICAVGTAARRLIAEGIIPDTIVTMDYSSASVKYIEDLTIAEGETWPTLIVDARAHPRAAQVYGGPVIFLPDAKTHHLCTGSTADATQMFKPAATVAHQAFCFLQSMGFETIMLCGLDLGNPYGVTHIPGIATYDEWFCSLNRFSSYEMLEWEQIIRFRHELIRSVDIDGNPLYTDSIMQTYLDAFNKAIVSSPARVIDGTEGGVRKQGAQTMPLQQALAVCGAVHTIALPPHSTIEVLNRKEYKHQLIQTSAMAEDLEEAMLKNAPMERIIFHQKMLMSYPLLIEFAECLEPEDSMMLKKRDRHIEAELDQSVRIDLQQKRDLYYVRSLKKGLSTLVAHEV